MFRTCFALLLGVLAAGPSAAADWPVFMGDAAHRGRADTDKDLSRLQLEWRFELHAETRSSPVAVGGQLYIGAENGNLYAIDLESRQLNWIFHGRGGFSGAPAVHGELVYALSRDGHLYALDRDSGEERWRFATGGERYFSAPLLYGERLGPQGQQPVPDPWDFYLSSPVICEGKLFFGSSDQRLYALDPESGELQWSFKTGGQVHSAPACAGNRVLVSSWDSNLYALEAESGKEIWRFRGESEHQYSTWLGFQASPAVDGKRVYLGSRDGYAYAIDLESGERLWRYDAERSWVVTTAAFDGERLYLGTSDTGLLLALDKRSGEEVYRRKQGVWTYASGLLAGGALVMGDMKGELLALDASSGEPLWSHRDPQSQLDPYGALDPQGRFDGKRLYGSRTKLYSSLEHIKRLGAFLSTPIWHRDRLIAANTKGEILVFR